MMRKSFLILVATSFLAANSLSAQTIRIEGGAAASKISISKGADTHESEVKVGYRYGAAIEFKLFPMVYIAAGANMSKGGGRLGVFDKYLNEFTGGAIQNDEDLNQYLGGFKLFSSPTITTTSVSVPILLGVRLKPAGILGVSLEAGPYFSYDLQTTLDWGSYSADLTNMTKNSLGLIKYNRSGYGIAASATVELTRFYLRAGLEYGLSNRLSFERNADDEGKLIEAVKAEAPSPVAKYLTDDALLRANLSEGLDELMGTKTRTMQAYVTLGFRI